MFGLFGVCVCFIKMCSNIFMCHCPQSNRRGPRQCPMSRPNRWQEAWQWNPPEDAHSGGETCDFFWGINYCKINRLISTINPSLVFIFFIVLFFEREIKDLIIIQYSRHAESAISNTIYEQLNLQKLQRRHNHLTAKMVASGGIILKCWSVNYCVLSDLPIEYLDGPPTDPTFNHDFVGCLPWGTNARAWFGYCRTAQRTGDWTPGPGSKFGAPDRWKWFDLP